MTQAAVLTGDLVGSTEAGPEAVDKAMALLADAADSLSLWQHGTELRFTRYRGDGWQALIMPSRSFLRATAYFLAHLRSWDSALETRIGIGIGDVISIGTEDLSDAHGSAFINSGQALEQIGKSDRLAIAGLPEKQLAWCQASLETLTYLSSRWSTEQSQAIALQLLFENVSKFDMAKNLEISRQALSSRLAVAGEKPIMAAIRAAEETL